MKIYKLIIKKFKQWLICLNLTFNKLSQRKVMRILPRGYIVTGLKIRADSFIFALLTNTDICWQLARRRAEIDEDLLK